MLHKLKIKKKYLVRILQGEKTFEIRLNDRDYQVGDQIEFLPIKDDIHDICEYCPDVKIPLYEITYLYYAPFLDSGYVVLSIKAINERN